MVGHGGWRLGGWGRGVGGVGGLGGAEFIVLISTGKLRVLFAQRKPMKQKLKIRMGKLLQCLCR